MAEPEPVVGATPATSDQVGTSPIFVGGDDDPGGRDIVSATVAGSVANAQARFTEHERDTHATGSTTGDLMTLPPVPEEAATDDPTI